MQASILVIRKKKEKRGSWVRGEILVEWAHGCRVESSHREEERKRGKRRTGRQPMKTQAWQAIRRP